MKKFASMMMAAVMIFALAVPAFAAQTSSTSVKATMQTPKIAVTAGKVSVIANPYKIKVTVGSSQVQDQIVNTPVAFVNKSDTGLDLALIVTPAKTNNIKFLPEADLATAARTVKGGDGDDASDQVPCACVTVKALMVDDTAYSASSAPAADAFTGAKCLTAVMNGTTQVVGTTGKKDTDDETKNDSYTNVNGSGDNANDAKTITLVAPSDTAGNAVWVSVSGKMSNNVDYTTWVDSAKKAANLEFTVAFLMTPHENAVS